MEGLMGNRADMADTPDANAALTVSGLCKTYDNFELRDVSFELPGGSVMGLIGENGAGKSTVFKAIMGLIRIDSGKVSFWGKTPQDEKDFRLIKEQIGVVFDGMGFYEMLTPLQMSRVCRDIYSGWDDEAYRGVLKRFGLPEAARVKTYSKGMRAKLSLALAMSHHPKLLILDEPTSGLDPMMRDEILDVFLDFVQDEEHSIIISSHITSDLEKIADFITFIHDGQIEFTEPKDELIYEYGIIRCSTADFDRISRSDMLAYRDMGHQMDVLVRHRDEAARKYSGMIIDQPKIDEIMSMYVKGVRV